MWLVSIIDVYHPRDTENTLYQDEQKAIAKLDESLKRFDIETSKSHDDRQIYSNGEGDVIVFEKLSVTK